MFLASEMDSRRQVLVVYTCSRSLICCMYKYYYGFISYTKWMVQLRIEIYFIWLGREKLGRSQRKNLQSLLVYSAEFHHSPITSVPLIIGESQVFPNIGGWTLPESASFDIDDH